MFRSIIVVCLGNICRSPVGEQYLSAGLPGLRVNSAGLQALVGEAADPVTAEVAARQGVNVSGHVARQLTAELGAAHDLILVMEKAHRNEIAARMPQLSGRTMLFGQWIDGGLDVPDPFRQSIEVHQTAVALIRRAGDGWITRLRQAG